MDAQVIDPRKLAIRLVFPTLFEVEGWKRIRFFPNTFEIFGFDLNNVQLDFEEVELPISIGNAEIYHSAGQNYPLSCRSTFLV